MKHDLQQAYQNLADVLTNPEINIAGLKRARDVFDPQTDPKIIEIITREIQQREEKTALRCQITRIRKFFDKLGTKLFL